MKRKFTDGQRVLLVRQYESGVSVSEICRQHNISRSTFYDWIKKFDIKKETQTKHILNIKLEKTNLKLEVLAQVNCNKNSPLKEKLYELEKLHGKYSVHVLCEALDVSRGTYYNHILRNKKQDTTYAKRKNEITKEVIAVFHETNEIFGARKIAEILKVRGVTTSPRYVSEIMKEQGLKSIRTTAKKDFKKFAPKKDFLFCNFRTDAPNEIWVSDTSHIPFKGKFYYMCVVLDLYSRKVIAYKLSEKHTTNLVSATFKNAFEARNRPENLIFHSDRGTQYTSTAFRRMLKNLGVTQSYSPTKKPTHNAVMESFFANLKKEEIYRNNYTSYAHLKKRIDEYIVFYNDVRPHAYINYKTPTAFESDK